VASVVAFAPGYYVFEVTAKDGEADSLPVRLAFEARADGAPIPRAQLEVATSEPVVGDLVVLDGRGSTGAARYRFTQVGGPWVPLEEAAGVATFRAHSAGRYAFELEVDDGAVRSAPERVEIDVGSPGNDGPAGPGR
jgi:hypothetical protein